MSVAAKMAALFWYFGKYMKNNCSSELNLQFFFKSATNLCTGELGYDGPLYDGFLHMTDDRLGPSPMHIKYSSYVYD